VEGSCEHGIEPSGSMKCYGKPAVGDLVNILHSNLLFASLTPLQTGIFKRL
jgi:hypothetical protein